jgi:hypothetical protein
MQKWNIAVLALVLLFFATAALDPADAMGKRGSRKNYSKFCLGLYDNCFIQCGINYPDTAGELTAFQGCLKDCDELIDVCQDAADKKIKVPKGSLLNSNPNRPGTQMLNEPNLSPGAPPVGGLGQ